MERFVFVAAIVVAVIFGLGAIFGHGGPHMGWHFEIDDDGGSPSELVQLTSGQMAAVTHQGEELRIVHAAARVVVTPEDRQDFVIEIDNPGGAPMPEVSVEDGDVVVNGRLRGRISNCADDSVDLRGYGRVATDQLPLITIHAPRALNIEIGGAGSAEIGPTQTLHLEHRGCGRVTSGDVAGTAEISARGAGQLRVGNTSALTVDLEGTGSLTAGTVTGDAEIEIDGTGTVEIASLTGALNADNTGTGNVRILGGDISTAEIDLTGVGDVRIDAPVASMNVTVMGPGRVTVNGAVGDLEAEVMGPGDVRVTSVTGRVSQQVHGPGHVSVGP